jgi:dipeptidyl aminopeptidase/acylaminoacyl peptidase
VTHQPLGERDILRFRMLSEPQLSPDGRQVAFVLTEQDASADRQATSVWLVPSDGSAEARRLTAGPRDARPRWSPDGGRLAFLGAREREWAKDLYVLPLAGGEPQRVAELPRGITDYAWSVDGSADLRTPAEQAEQVFIRLRKMGREVDLVVFHGESHAIAVQGRPWNRVRHSRAVREWFDRHLRGGEA